MLAKTTYKADVSKLLYQIENEVQNSLNNSLIYNSSKSEIERFQAAYSLKSTRQLYNELKKNTSPYQYDIQLSEKIQNLGEDLTNFNQNIADLIDTDDQLFEIINQVDQNADSIQENFIIKKYSMGTEIPEVKMLNIIYESVQNQLSTIDNYFYTVNSKEINEIKASSPIVIYIIFIVTIILLLTALGYYIIKNHKLSVSELGNTLAQIAKGELPDNKIGSNSEIGEIVETSNSLVNYLDDASQFAIKIGDGNFDYEFQPKSDHDTLGNSLIEMRNRLQEVANTDKIRHWINEGQAKFGDILRHHNNDIEALGSHVLSYLIEYMQASQGALFVLKKENSKDYLELLSAYAYKRRKFVEHKFEPDESLAGRSFLEGKTIHITDIQTDHYNIQTGLGESKPSSILIVPLKDEDRIEGILEIASLKAFEKHHIEFIESIGESIASSLSAGESNQITSKLLSETQEKAEEMEAQEEELRQNMEELAATQEQLERSYKENIEKTLQLEGQMSIINMAALVSKTNKKGIITYVNDLFCEVAGYTRKELIGQNHNIVRHPDMTKSAFKDMWKTIGSGKVWSGKVKNKTKNGSYYWVDANIGPVMDEDGKPKEYVGVRYLVTDYVDDKKLIKLIHQKYPDKDI